MSSATTQNDFLRDTECRSVETDDHPRLVRRVIEHVDPIPEASFDLGPVLRGLVVPILASIEPVASTIRVLPSPCRQPGYLPRTRLAGYRPPNCDRVGLPTLFYERAIDNARRDWTAPRRRMHVGKPTGAVSRRQ
jgi:hypothetical protein